MRATTASPRPPLQNRVGFAAQSAPLEPIQCRRRGWWILFGLMGMLTAPSLVWGQSRPWLNHSLPIVQRVNLLLRQMTLTEKLNMLHGWGGSPYVGYVPANTRLGIPALKLEDGPCGVADGMRDVTAFPSAIAISASWDPSLMKQYGYDIATEEWDKGANVMLGPTINILRNPVWGRSFESLGEDPYLNARMGVASVDGIQSAGVIATSKHYDAYNQEFDRGNGSADVNERALHEIYMPAFEAVVKEAKTGAVMTAYNRINGTFCSENRYILTDVLNRRWHFRGFTMSDWGGTHSTVPAANNGLDMQMPDGSFFGGPLLAAVKNGQVSQAIINAKIRHILYQMFRFHLFSRKQTGIAQSIVTNPAHARFSRVADEEGTVLLKNSGGILPLSSARVHSIAVIGYAASTNPKPVGGGSASVVPPYVITPLQGIQNLVGRKITVRYAEGVAGSAGALPPIPSSYLSPSADSSQHGLSAEYFNNMSLSGQPVLSRIDSRTTFNWHGGSPVAGVSGSNWSAEWSGVLTPPRSGLYTFSLTSDDGSRLFIAGKQLINDWSDHAAQTESGTVQLTAGQPVNIKIEYYQDTGDSLIALGWRAPGGHSLLHQAAAAARKSDVAIVYVSDNESEGSDRPNLTLPNNQDQLIEAVAQANPHTIVVLNTGAPVLMPWVNRVAGIVEAWYPGQEDGNAIAAVLFGAVDPGGKLPMTFPRRAGDIPAHTMAQYPGINGVSKYTEGIFVGYRYYDEHHIQPLFPFGFGLSYTTFAYRNLQINPSRVNGRRDVTVSLDVKNTGHRAGSEVVQIYVGDPASTGEPPKQLAGFQKVTLKAGQTKRVRIVLRARAFSYWDTARQSRVIANGDYRIMAASSSRDIRLEGMVHLSE